MLHLVCLSVSKSNREPLTRVLGRLPHRLTFFTPGDLAATTRASTAHAEDAVGSLRTFLESRVESWQDHDPVVILSRGVGNGLVFRWLMREDDRELVTAVVLLDALPHAPSHLTEHSNELAGVIEFARDCLADPHEKRLVAVGAPPRLGVSLDTLLRAALWPTPEVGLEGRGEAPRGVELLELTELGADDLPEAALALLGSHLVPFLVSLGPASAPEPL